jgi:hypothetical protein
MEKFRPRRGPVWEKARVMKNGSFTERARSAT